MVRIDDDKTEASYPHDEYTPTFRLRLILLSERLGTGDIRKHVLFSDVVEDDGGFTAVWSNTATLRAEEFLRKAQQRGVTS